jgi:hypothetical protein
MARDLIPPPSPSGRPQLEGTGTPRLIELPPDPPPPTQPAAPEPPRALPPSRFRNRFGFLMGALGGVVLAAAAIVAIVVSTGDGTADEGLAKNWSAWQPQETSMTAGPAEIAAHVAPQYKDDNGKQIVNVTGGPLEVQGIKLGLILREPTASGGLHEFDGKAVMYTLNGLGPRGSMKGGTPSTKRHQLLRREALELALYTFRYMPEADMVVTLLPPPPPDGSDSSASASSSGSSADSNDPPVQAVFYRPGDLKSQLQVPLGATVPSKAPTPDTIPAAEGRTIDSLTLSNLFQASYTQAQNLQPYMVLDRPTG